MIMHPLLQSIMGGGPAELRWLSSWGIGYLPVTANPYDASYAQKYADMSTTPMGIDITKFRVGLVNAWWRGSLVDVGVGCGAFVAHRKSMGLDTWGYDINPWGIQWLKKRGAWLDINDPTTKISGVSFFDVLEHVANPFPILQKAAGPVFITIPIFQNRSHALASKHYRPDEHCWYFTEAGLCNFMLFAGYRMEHGTDYESQLGREDIKTYVFIRKPL